MPLQHFTLLSQKLVLNVDLENKRIIGESKMLLRPKREFSSIPEKLRLHCRQCKVQVVLIDGQQVEFEHMDTLSRVVTENYRDMESYELFHYGALAASNMGELIISLPPGGTNPPSEFNLVVKYELQNPLAGAYFMGPDESNPSRPHYMYTYHPPYGGCADGARTWIPCIDTLNEDR